MDRDPALWPDLPYPAWRGTAATLQLWTQIVGKIRLSLTPWVNHSWQVALYVTARGLGTSPIPFGNEILEIELDFISHRLLARTSQGEERTLALEPQSVADFYSRVVDLLSAVGVSVSINEMPCEVPDPIRFSEDHTHAAYDAAAAHRFWRVLVQIDRGFKLFRSGFLGKVKRTSVLQHYGLKTLLYGVLLPGPHIGRRCGPQLQDIARRGFEVGVHTWDHVRWQDGVARASEPWTRRELTLARDQFAEVFGRAPLVHGAAGWQTNRYVPALERELGFRYASDTRGTGPFVPLLDHGAAAVPQLPTTLPTLDELIGRVDPVDHLLAVTAGAPAGDHVFTLHAELEGGAYLPSFERLLRAWQQRGTRLTDLATYAAQLDFASLPRCSIVAGTVEGRSGRLAMQSQWKK